MAIDVTEAQISRAWNKSESKPHNDGTST